MGRIGIGSIFLGRDVDVAQVVGNGTKSSVFAPIGFWMQRAFMEAKPMAYRLMRDGKMRDEPKHEFLKLLAKPNPFYSAKNLIGGALWDYMTDGNGYWLKIREQRGNRIWYEDVVSPVKWILWAPSSFIMPVGDEFDFISGYQYTAAGRTVLVAPENVVHFRHGLDPDDPRRGLSPLRSQLNELAADSKASSMMARLLHNMGIPGLMASPKNQDVGWGSQSPEDIKQVLIDKTTGARQGEPIVFHMPTDLQQFGFEPRRLELGGLRSTAEERLCAVFGIHAAVIGYGTGMEQTKVGATLAELRKLSYLNGVIPVQDDFAAEIERAFDREYAGGLLFYFNRDEVEALAEDRKILMDTALAGWQGDLLTMYEAREDIGADTEDWMKVFRSEWMPPTPPALPGQDPAQDVEQDPAKNLPKRRKALNPARFKHEGSPAELAILERSTPGEKTPEQIRFMERLERSEEKRQKAFAKDLEFWFDEEMGADLERLALDVIPAAPKARHLNGHGTTVSLLEAKELSTELYTSEIMQRLDTERKKRGLQALGEAFYLGVAQDVFEALNDYPGLAIELSDSIAEAVMRQGGRNLGLVDLTASTRAKLFEVLTEAQELALGPKETARRIRELVPAGPWGSVETRADVIARTEVMNAQRVSTLTAYRAMDNVQQSMVFDNRTGFDDEICSSLDGRIVSLEDAAILADAEHPRGTRSFAPYIP